jgi:hypothetical protein
MAAVKYLTNRMNTYYLNTTSKERESKIIKHILQENKYDTSIMDITPPNPKTSKQKQIKMGKVYDVGKETKFITKPLKNSTVNISYTTSNTFKAVYPQTK